jgi:PAS domain S-box-containing protein
MSEKPSSANRHAKKTRDQLVDELTLLEEALETIADGFILFDAEDRVVHFNAKHMELFGSTAHVLKTGARFEDLLRAQLESSQIDRAVGREEDWIRERTFNHKNPGEPIEQEFADGRIIRLWERLTPSGGVVAIRSDITALRKAQTVLQESERQYHELAELSPDSVIVQVNGRIRFANRHACEMLGAASTDELIGLDSLSIVDPEVRDTLVDSRIETLETRKSIPYLETRHRRLDGTTFPSEMAIGPVFWDGEFGTANVIRDISTRKLAEEALRESEKRFQDFAESTSDWLWELDKDFRFIADTGDVSSTGIAGADLFGKTRWEMADAGNEDELWRQHRSDLESHLPFRDFQYRYIAQDGSTRHGKISGRPVFDENEAFVGYRGTGTDITAEITARASEQLIENRFFALIDSMPMGIHIWDADEKLIIANRMHHEWLPELTDVMQPGARYEDLVRSDVERGFVIGALDREEEYIAERLHRFRTVRNGVIEEQWVKDRWLHVINYSLPDGGVICLNIDVTDLKERDEQIRQTQKMDSLGQLTGGIAHDFNNLLAVILGNAELIASGLAEPDANLDHHANAVVKAALRGSELTHRLLAFSRKQALAPKIVDLNQLLPDAVGMLRRTLGEEIEIQLEPDAELWHCSADPGQIENALLNLGINARDAMPEGGPLVISTSNIVLDKSFSGADLDFSPGDYVRMSVQDSGTGMSGDLINKAFEPFFTTKEAGKGTGLGLSMVFGFAKQSGGHASIDSDEGCGTTVSLYLPRAEVSE